MVAAGDVRARVVCVARLCVLVDDFWCVCLRCVFVRFWVHWEWVAGFIFMLRSVPGVRWACDGLERCCGVSAVCGIYGIGCEVR